MPTTLLVRPIEYVSPRRDRLGMLIASILTLTFALALVAAIVHPAPPPQDGEILVSGP